jgi:hypothetical protein
MLRRVTLVRTDVSEELSASFIGVTRISELGTTLAVTSNRRTLRRNTSNFTRKYLCHDSIQKETELFKHNCLNEDENWPSVVEYKYTVHNNTLTQIFGPATNMVEEQCAGSFHDPRRPGATGRLHVMFIARRVTCADNALPSSYVTHPVTK